MNSNLFQPRSLVLGGIPLLATLALTTGCGGAITGDWHMASCIPNPETFAIDNARFESDGRFTATVTLEGKTAVETGTYKFNGYRLYLRPKAGGERSYQATRKPATLDIIDGNRRVVLKKGKKPGA